VAKTVPKGLKTEKHPLINECFSVAKKNDFLKKIFIFIYSLGKTMV
jgi:hypothetical protein